MLLQALVHSSFVHESKADGLVSNERLEYLGDAVLDLAIGEYLFLNCPNVPEGELTRIRASIVCEPMLYRIASELNLGACLQLGQGEERSGGRNRSSILADALEALIGAIFLDGGYISAKNFIRLRFKDVLNDALKGDLIRDFKTMLQELVQSKKMGDLSYHLLSESGPDHNKMFLVAVCVDGVQIGEGKGRSKKEAEQQAAKTGIHNLQK